MVLIVPRLVLVTTRVCYYQPRFPSILGELVWQCDDVVPGMPRVRRYLDHWRREIDAVIASIEIAHDDCSDWRDARCLLDY